MPNAYGRFELSPSAGHGWTVTSELCASDDPALCPDGHLAVAAEGTSAEVVVHLLGFYGPAALSTELESPTATDKSNAAAVADKALESPFWEAGTTNGDIHYSNGFVGIGTVNPWSPLHVYGLDADYPNNKAFRVHTFGESPNYRDHVVINGESESGYGIAFRGITAAVSMLETSVGASWRRGRSHCGPAVEATSVCWRKMWASVAIPKQSCTSKDRREWTGAFV